MPILADTHIHVYPFYELSLFFGGAFRKFAALEEGADHVLFLAERHDCHFFRQLKEGLSKVSGMECAAGEEVLTIRNRNGKRLWLAAGRQIVTAERLEILALTTDAEIPDGQPARDVIRRIREIGAVPVIAWAPGKWFFGRGKVVRALIDSEPAGSFLLGDSTLRPTVWPEPLLMRRAKKKGFKVVAGSDPLPVPGEEAKAVSYGIRCDGNIDPAQPLKSLRDMLTNLPGAKNFGRRDSLLSVLTRLKKNSSAKS
ncbi:MAG TPA: hypothetical protein PKM67_07395 [Kiritimatiellia bacterium]|nr:hypothetical protein [Kiritimatiellia bacterium]HNR94147.1 hypothetical protein [Kiritimatiellia bacterium]HNS81265.1 hypothetical protein [Kiritimatiellia bacterium]HPA78732.1 hypothetical protein [Kiritimatiellia bacterium]HQQ05223.1 hypothetical protein [Kiritimatiellia bacterium]